MSDESATDVPVTKGEVEVNTSGDETNGVSGKEEHNDSIMSSEGQTTDHDSPSSPDHDSSASPDHESPASPDPMNDTNTSVYSEEQHENGQGEKEPLSFEILQTSEGQGKEQESADTSVNSEDQRLDSGPPSSFYMVGSDDSLEPKGKTEGEASTKDTENVETEHSIDHEKGADAGDTDESKTESHAEDEVLEKEESVEPEGEAHPDSGRDSPVMHPPTPNTVEGDIMQKSVVNELQDASTEEPSIYKTEDGDKDADEDDENEDASPSSDEKPVTTESPVAVTTETSSTVASQAPADSPAVSSETPAVHSQIAPETTEEKTEEAAPSDPLSLASANPEAVPLEPTIPNESHPKPKTNGAVHEHHSEDHKEETPARSEPAQVYHRANQESDSEDETSRAKKSSKNTSKAAGCLCC